MLTLKKTVMLVLTAILTLWLLYACGHGENKGTSSDTSESQAVSSVAAESSAGNSSGESSENQPSDESSAAEISVDESSTQDTSSAVPSESESSEEESSEEESSQEEPSNDESSEDESSVEESSEEESSETEPSEDESSAEKSSEDESNESSEEELSEDESSEEEAVKNWPYIQGSFIQYSPFLNYSETQLEKHFDYLKEAGIEYLVLYSSAFLDKEGKYTTIYYPSEYAKTKKSANFSDTYSDITEKILKQCQSHGIKAYITPITMDGWGNTWGVGQKEKTDVFVKETLEISKEMYNLFKGKYGDTFYGWYFAPEFSNYFMYWNDTYYNNTRDMFNAILEGYNKIDKTMPFMLSPYFADYYPYSNPKDTAAAWDRIFSGINFRKGDIFCPQDCVGSGLVKIGSFTEFYSEFKKVIDKYENLAFWGNPEDFVQVNWSSAPVTRYVLQLEKAAEYVEGFISFAYSHYYAPDIAGTDKFHNDYVSYFNTGRVDYYGENRTPAFVSTNYTPVTAGVKLEAVVNNCKYGVFKVEFYRGGTLVATVITSEEDYGKPRLTLTGYDKAITENGEYAYYAKVYAFSGEIVSSEVKKIQIEVDKCISIGKKYTTDYKGSSTYPDDGKKLTDGKFATTSSYADSAASGFAGTTNVYFIIDLEGEYAISAVVARALNSGSGGAIIPTTVRVSFSADGSTYSNQIALDGPSRPTEAGWAVAEFNTGGVKARYVKIEYLALRNWLFIDEFSVYGS